MIINRNTRDLYTTDDGDFSFADLGDDGGDILTTRGMENRVWHQTMLCRLNGNSEFWGFPEERKGVSRFLERINVRKGVERVCANLEDFHGEPMNSTTLDLIRRSVLDALTEENAFGMADVNVSVIKITNNIVNVMVVLRLKHFANIEKLVDPNARIGDFEEPEQVIVWSGNYNSNSTDFSMSRIDIKDEIEGLNEDPNSRRR